MHVHRTATRPAGRGGFTLVEVLVVMGIIAVLMGILMPALRAAREQAQQVKCAAQLRQLGFGLMLYANANKGWLPSWSGWHAYPDGSSPADEPGLAWTEMLEPYFVKPDSPLYSCPSFAADPPLSNYFLAARWSGQNGRHAMKLSDVRLSSRFILGGDTTNRHLYAPPYGDNPNTAQDYDRDDAIMPCLAFLDDDGGFLMHRGGNNVLFDDLHVQAFRDFDPGAMTYHPTQMLDWNHVKADQ
jgi:prepilin-type N-terminal cleavage/methylation domain-containing protein